MLPAVWEKTKTNKQTKKKTKKKNTNNNNNTVYFGSVDTGAFRCFGASRYFHVPLSASCVYRNYNVGVAEVKMQCLL